MNLRVAIHHKTSYTFSRPVIVGPHIVRLRPAPNCRTPVAGYSFRVWPSNHFVNWQQDPYGNHLARLVLPDKCEQLTIEVDLIAELRGVNPFDFFVDDSALRFPFVYESRLQRDLHPFLAVTEAGTELREFLTTIDRSEQPTIEMLVKLNQHVQREIQYQARMEAGFQTPEETLRLGRGSCRDTAWLEIQALRHLGLASRFVSGYLIQLASDAPALDDPAAPEEDTIELHAWTEVYIPGAGWIGLDPTSGYLATEGHLPLACTSEPGSAAPISGTVEECETEFTYTLEMRRIRDDGQVAGRQGSGQAS